jgi:phosphohistidine phosphatase
MGATMGGMQDSVKQRGHTLIVMRHAKAGELPGGPDFERALRPRGQRDSAAAGRWLAARGLHPGLVLCSAARRTRQTWQHLSGPLLAHSAWPEPDFVADQRLYNADSDDIADLVRETGDDIETVLYIGHNPAAAELVEQLTGAEPAFPTAAIAVIGVRSDWPGLAAGGCELTASWTPHDGDPAG